MSRQNPFQHQQFLASGYQADHRETAQPTHDLQPSNNPFLRRPRNNYKPGYEREQTEDIQYSAAYHPYIELQPSFNRQRSNDAQFQASPERPTHSRPLPALQHSNEQLYAGDQGYIPDQHETSSSPMGQHQSRKQNPVSRPPTLTGKEIFETQCPPSTWEGPVTPRSPLPYPIPPMRDYQHFNDSFHKFTIKGPRPKLIERLNTIAARDARTRGYFSDTGLVSVNSIDRDFCTKEYILFHCDHLVEPITVEEHQRVFPTTFGIMGEDRRTGRWHVRCWIQLSNRISREIQLMVKEKLVVAAGVVAKEVPRARDLNGRMAIQEHEMIWMLIQGWDRQGRREWFESFQAEGGAPVDGEGLLVPLIG